MSTDPSAPGPDLEVPVPDDPDPEAAQPAPAGGRHLSGPAVLAAVLVVVGLAFVGWVAVQSRGSSPSPTPTATGTAAPGPVLADQAALQGIQKALGHEVYWAGTQGLTQWEVTLNGSDVYVRYLPAGQPVGSTAPYLTVGTYVKQGAYAGLEAAAKEQGATSEKLSGGALVVQPAGKPTSAYFAFQGADLLMEVFDTTPGKAYTLIGSGAIQPVP